MPWMLAESAAVAGAAPAAVAWARASTTARISATSTIGNRSIRFLPCRSVRPDVLVHAKQIRGIVLALERLQARPLLRAVRLLHPLLALLHEEVHVDARVIRLERGPEVAGPLALGLE